MGLLLQLLAMEGSRSSGFAGVVMAQINAVLAALPPVPSSTPTTAVPPLFPHWSPPPESERPISVNASYVWTTPVRSGAITNVLSAAGV